MNLELPSSKRYFRIGEVSRITGVKPHVLRYWESEFGIVSPEKTRSNQRIYDRDDLALIMEIKRLLYDEKYTIIGAKKRIRDIKKEKKQLDIPFSEQGDIMALIKGELEGIRQWVNPFLSEFCRGVAQPGSAHAWGAWGRGFESRRPDQIKKQG